MRMRDTGGKRPCAHCGKPTAFERVFRGPRAAERTEVCCCDCGGEKDGEKHVRL